LRYRQAAAQADAVRDRIGLGKELFPGDEAGAFRSEAAFRQEC